MYSEFKGPGVIQPELRSGLLSRSPCLSAPGHTQGSTGTWGGPLSVLGKYPQNCQDEENYRRLGLSPGREQERSQVGDWASPGGIALALGRK